MPLQKTNLGAPAKRCQIHKTPTPKFDPNKTHSISIEITFQHGSYSTNSPPTSRTLSHKNFHGELLLKRESDLWKNVYNTNMTKHCTINLNASYRIKFGIFKDDTRVFSKNMLDFLHHMYLLWHYFIKSSSRYYICCNVRELKNGVY